MGKKSKAVNHHIEQNAENQNLKPNTVSQNIIAKWLARIFSLNGLSLLASLVGVFFAYLQYNSQGELSICLRNDESHEDFSDKTLFYEFKAINKHAFQHFYEAPDYLHLPYFVNKSNKPVKNINLQVEIVFDLGGIESLKNVDIYKEYRIIEEAKESNTIYSNGDTMTYIYPLPRYITELEVPNLNPGGELYLPIKKIHWSSFNSHFNLPLEFWMNVKLSAESMATPIKFNYRAVVYNVEVNQEELMEELEENNTLTEDQKNDLLFEYLIPNPTPLWEYSQVYRLIGDSLEEARNKWFMRFDFEDEDNAQLLPTTLFIYQDTLVSNIKQDKIKKNSCSLNDLKNFGKFRFLGNDYSIETSSAYVK